MKRLTEGTLVERLEDGRAAVYVPETDQVHVLNRTAAAVLDTLERGESLDALAKGLALEHGVPSEEIRGDLEEAVAHMEALGILGDG